MVRRLRVDALFGVIETLVLVVTPLVEAVALVFGIPSCAHLVVMMHCLEHLVTALGA